MEAFLYDPSESLHVISFYYFIQVYPFKVVKYELNWV